MQSVDYCANLVANALLYNKVEYAHAKGIKTEVQLHLAADVPIQGINLIGLFSNLLDNAIESCVALDEDERFIRVADFCDANTYTVKVVNSKDASEVILADGKLPTSKKEPDMHGLGTDIVSEIAKRYGGCARFHDRGASFEAVVLLTLAN